MKSLVVCVFVAVCSLHITFADENFDNSVDVGGGKGEQGSNGCFSYTNGDCLDGTNDGFQSHLRGISDWLVTQLQQVQMMQIYSGYRSDDTISGFVSCLLKRLEDNRLIKSQTCSSRVDRGRSLFGKDNNNEVSNGWNRKQAQPSKESERKGESSKEPIKEDAQYGHEFNNEEPVTKLSNVASTIGLPTAEASTTLATSLETDFRSGLEGTTESSTQLPGVMSRDDEVLTSTIRTAFTESISEVPDQHEQDILTTVFPSGRNGFETTIKTEAVELTTQSSTESLHDAITSTSQYGNDTTTESTMEDTQVGTTPLSLNDEEIVGTTNSLAIAPNMEETTKSMNELETTQKTTETTTLQPQNSDEGNSTPSELTTAPSEQTLDDNVEETTLSSETTTFSSESTTSDYDSIITTTTMLPIKVA